ncbi:hypothetical protein ANAEL_03486 [Anaerolineales bacterium]|nr:hypothetical protein ANAEL_03486 [Anaerolineales bacterium]
MKKIPSLISIILLCGLILAACSSATQPPPQPSEAVVVESAATEAPTVEVQATAAPATAEPEAAPAIQHTNVPASPPASGGEKWGDHSTVSSNNAARALLGDDFTEGKFERPYNADTMDAYFPQLDIDRIVVHPEDATWVYALITMVGRDASNAFTGQYAIELDLDRNGRGEFLIVVDQPSSADWTTEGVRVYKDANLDIGGVKPMIADSEGVTSNGYEAVLFDQGTGDDPDLAWYRLDPGDPNSIQVAYKQSLLGGVTKYTAGIWAGTHLDPALFDYNDHYKYEQAGAANPEIKNFYPIKGLSELDNTCRQAIGYDATGLEPGICP